MAGRSVGALRDRVDRVRSGLVRLPRVLKAEPLPHVRLRTGRVTVPVAVARLGAVLLTAAAAVPFRGSVVELVLLGLAAVLLYLRPAGVAGPVVTGLVGLFWAAEPTGLTDPWTYLLLALATAVPALTAALGPVSLTARVEPAVLLSALRRYLVLQLVSQPLLAAGLAVSALQLSVLPIAVAGAAVVAVGGWLLLPRLHRDR